MSEPTDYQQTLDSLRGLLMQGTVATHEDICAQLLTQGYDVNQSKVSRMLRKLGAVKGQNERDELVYRLPKEPAPPSKKTQLSELIMDISANEVMVIIHTSPGSASMIARLLDYSRDTSAIMGTVAGDDTILVIPKSIKNTAMILKEIKALLN